MISLWLTHATFVFSVVLSQLQFYLALTLQPTSAKAFTIYAYPFIAAMSIGHLGYLCLASDQLRSACGFAETTVVVVVAEAKTMAVTLTELRKSERNVHRPNYEELDGGREDFKSDSDDESRATKRCKVSTDKGNNGTVSEAVSSVKCLAG